MTTTADDDTNREKLDAILHDPRHGSRTPMIVYKAATRMVPATLSPDELDGYAHFHSDDEGADWTVTLLAGHRLITIEASSPHRQWTMDSERYHPEQLRERIGPVVLMRRLTDLRAVRISEVEMDRAPYGDNFEIHGFTVEAAFESGETALRVPVIDEGAQRYASRDRLVARLLAAL
jgi:hypothetical protein